MAWGVAALVWKIAWPHAQPESLRRRVGTAVVFFAVGIALVLGIRHELGREPRRFREIAQAAQQVLRARCRRAWTGWRSPPALRSRPPP
ncbi:hypothetical protein [Streptomyces sp. NBC_00829]|uniref:hypothetical protein n=1 Tax=Streptomyces sp. NBC_00829 TaxID=2903679 RepID=UPI003862EC30|nr:hypothetical protein OG293_29880 [Streptomyces sp. NBC_00829]